MKSDSIQMKCHLKAAAWGLPGEINVMQLRAGCNGGHAVMSNEVILRFIALPIEFEGIALPPADRFQVNAFVSMCKKARGTKAVSTARVCI